MNEEEQSITLEIKGYVRKNWGSPLLVGFILILCVAAAYLSSGFFYLANGLANFAFFALVAGVALQVICFLKYSEGMKKSQNGDSEKP